MNKFEFKPNKKSKDEQQLSFDEFKHVYYYADDKQGILKCISVTTFLRNFEPPFDEEKWSKHVANKEGKTQEEIKEQWAKKNKESKEFGSRIHKIAENYLNMTYANDTQPIAIHNKKEHDYFNHIKQFWQDAKLELIETEKMVCLPEYRLAGTIDLLAKSANTNFLLDWKTNSKFNLNNQYQNLLDPLEHLPSCELTKYSLQLSLYKHILEKRYKTKINYNALIHLNENEYTMYYCKHLDKEVEKLLEIRKKQVKQEELQEAKEKETK